ncbi:malic enzyme-like NAD(P)-binding protein [Streptomyces microflavus]|uniref:malic enzyme-like NAD(P)-binding protein n=1 Tax=Streptomyces microflavus TaxID=1919 RepID=UPI0036698BCB
MSALREARRGQGIVDLAEVVKQIHPTILIGTSTTPGRFTEAIVKDRAGCAVGLGLGGEP